MYYSGLSLRCLLQRFGRKTALLVLSVGLMASGLGCTYAPTFAVYCVFRFIEGSTCVPLAGAIFSYANEVAGRNLRSTVGTIIMFTTSISHTILPAMAYVLRDWRDLNLASALLPLAFIITWPFIPETPKWLLMKGKEEEARKVLNRYAKSRGKTLNEDDWQIVLDTEKKKMESISTRSHLTDLFRRPFTRIVSLVVLFDWFAVNCVFYGLVLNAGSLSGDPYVNGVLNGATEIIAVIVYGAVNKKYGAKVCIILGMLCSGSLCLVAMIAGEIDSTSETALQVVRWVSITGKLFATVSFYSTYQYTNDVFPVITRGKAMALASSFARVGSIIIPFILEVQSDSICVTQAILGFLGLSAGLATLIMPQTSSKVATTTLQEAEKGYRVNMKWMAKFIKYKRTTNENADERKVQIEYLDVETNNNNTIFTNHVTKL
uniref:solute carrier family 22 member 3-like n=1 Tax=Styela clava TaxID=7725 RepID=UPI001939F684|nr:solute carrier family 22 member 3-like [Styela clava]